MNEKNKASAIATAAEVVQGVEVIELPASYADFALAAGLAHDASKGDTLAKMAKDRADADAARVVSAKLLSAVGASTSDEAIGKLAAERTTLEQLVEAITGDKNASAQDAIAKLAADRKASELVEAKALIESAAAEGKTAGPKALELFEKHGMGALKAHLEALVPHAALKSNAPTQKQEPGGTKPKDAESEEVALTEDDKRFCEKNGIDPAAFLAARKDEIATRQENERRRNS